jgi:hypothetical protein
MKCVCGYEQGMGWVDNGIDADEYIEVNPDGDKFRKIKGYFVIETGESWSPDRQVNLYGCPECGTVQMERN